jgi:hypothetical protein
MRVLVQQSKGKAYLNNAGGWEDSPERARIFASMLAAMDYCIRRELWDVNLVAKLDASGQELVLPLARSVESSIGPDTMAYDR